MRLFYNVAVYLLTYITSPLGEAVLQCVSIFADLVPVPVSEVILQCVSTFADLYNSPSR
jgi:hypothetical protein